MTSWHHLACFSLPRKLVQQGISAEDFVRDLLRDGSDDGSLLPGRADEIIEALQTKKTAGSATAKGKDSSSAGGDESSAGLAWLEEIKKNFEATKDDKPSAAKKPKDDMNLLVDTYSEIYKFPLAKLKEVLQWNRQHVTGTKPILMIRLLDGALRGRLARCTLCAGGRLKLHDDGTTVTCGGAFDEERGIRLACQYQGTATSAPRWQPW